MNAKTQNNGIKAIFFDQGGVLVVDRVQNSSSDKNELDKIKEILNIEIDNDELKRKLIERENQYKKEGMENLVEENADTIWTKWLLPDYPDKALLKEQAEDLTLLYFLAKGPRFFRPEARDVIIELKKRGYKVGLISNTWSKKLVYQELKEGNFEGLFDELVLSSETNLRKPHPDMFTKPVERLGLNVKDAAYIGDQPNRDVEGPRNAGYGKIVIVKTEKLKNIDSLPPNHKPDVLIDNLDELLDIFY